MQYCERLGNFIENHVCPQTVLSIVKSEDLSTCLGCRHGQRLASLSPFTRHRMPIQKRIERDSVVAKLRMLGMFAGQV